MVETSPPIDLESRPHPSPSNRPPPSTPRTKPPIPPRPIARSTSRRKPVPVLSPFEEAAIVTPPADDFTPPVQHTRTPPSLPPRHILQPDQPQAEQAEKIHRVIPFKPKTRRLYQESKRGKRWCWIIAAGFILIAIVVGVIAYFVTHGSKSSPPNTDNGGHPLAIKDGGVVIGKPGDIATYGTGSTDHFVIQVNRSTVVTRLDPIVSPGGLSAHVHRFYGSSYVDENLHTASEMANLANCSTTAVQDDKSVYWVPQLYHQSLNGSLSMIPIRYHAAYYFQKAPTGVHLYPFPDNYNIVAGDPFRREVDPTDMSQKALWWICFRGGGNDTKTDGFPETACPDGLIAIIVMPSCWDGTVAADGDYTKHVTYPTDAPNGNICPKAYPNKFMTVQFETNFAVGGFPYDGEGTWVLANGDTTGLGIHADFVNGWRPGVQEQIIDKCRYMNKTDAYPDAKDINNCPPLEPSIDFSAAYNCRFQGEIVDEDVGGNASLSLLPGCNAIWSGTGPKPECPAGRTEGGALEKVNPNFWLREEPYIRG